MTLTSTAQRGPWLESSRHSCLFERLLALFEKLPWELRPSWVSLSGRGPGKEGWVFCSPLVALIKYSPTSPGTTVCYSRNYSVLPWRGGGGAGWRAQGQNCECTWGWAGEINSMRKEFSNCPFFLWRTVQFSQLDLRPGWREFYICSHSDLSCGRFDGFVVNDNEETQTDCEKSWPWMAGCQLLKPTEGVVLWDTECLIAVHTHGVAGHFDCCGWNGYWPWPKCHAWGSSVLFSVLLDCSHGPWRLALCVPTTLGWL